MPGLTGPALVAACLLVLAGAQKLVDPTMTVGALRSLRLPSSPALVRLGSAVELVVGVAALAWGGPALWWAVAASYLGFSAFVVLALRSGTMIGSCGCFGREETPPHWTHVVLNLLLAGLGAALATSFDGAPLVVLADHPATAVPMVGLAALAVYLLYAAMVTLPRALTATRSRGSRRPNPPTDRATP